VSAGPEAGATEQAGGSADRLTVADGARSLGRPRPLVLYLLGLGTVLLWGASFPLTKAALDYTGPTAVAFLRWAVSAVFLAGWLALGGRGERSARLSTGWRMIRKEWWTVAWVSVTGITLFHFLENAAMRFTTATNAGVLSNLTSVFMVLLGALILRERLRGIEWAGLAAAFLGSALVSQGAGHLTIGGPGIIGDGLMIVAGFFGAVFSIGGKGLSERNPPVVVTTALAGVGALFLLPLALVEGLSFNLPLGAWGIIALLGIGAGAAANLFWMSLLRHTPASRAALVLLMIPLVSAALSVALLHEPITPLLLIGTALVLAGVAMTQRRG
jgi:drug/metabolite transporter (DMT)-like permease